MCTRPQTPNTQVLKIVNGDVSLISSERKAKNRRNPNQRLTFITEEIGFKDSQS